MIDPDDYSNYMIDAQLVLASLALYDPTDLDSVRHIIREITDVIDHLKDLQDELVEAEGLLDPEGWYTG